MIKENQINALKTSIKKNKTQDVKIVGQYDGWTVKNLIDALSKFDLNSQIDISGDSECYDVHLYVTQTVDKTEEEIKRELKQKIKEFESMQKQKPHTPIFQKPIYSKKCSTKHTPIMCMSLSLNQNNTPHTEIFGITSMMSIKNCIHKMFICP
jgi:hypothetical protein